MEAALVALSGKGRPLTSGEYEELIERAGFRPEIMELG
jgi:hypothetical protein